MKKFFLFLIVGLITLTAFSAICTNSNSKSSTTTNYTYTDSRENFTVNFTVNDSVLVFNSQADKTSMENYFNDIFELTGVSYQGDFLFNEIAESEEVDFDINVLAEDSNNSQLALAVGGNNTGGNPVALSGGDTTYSCTGNSCNCCNFIEIDGEKIGCYCRDHALCDGEFTDCTFTITVKED